MFQAFFKHGRAMPLKPHVAALGSINFERLTASPAREGFVGMGACTEPVRTGIGTVCVECGRPEWSITNMNHTHTLSERVGKAPYTPHMTLDKRLVFTSKIKRR